MDLSENHLEFNEIEHWYYKEKFRHIKQSILKLAPGFQTLCDVGAGSAPFSRQLSKLFPERRFVAVDINYSKDILGQIEDGVEFDNKVCSADIYLLNDVLEHLENPKDLLRQIQEKAPRGSLFVITVPASMKLWSGHDIYLNHFRRYTKDLLLDDLTELHLLNLRTCYLFNFLFVPVFLTRRFSKRNIATQLSKSGSLQSLVAHLLINLDHLTRNQLPFGVSILAVFQLGVGERSI